MHGDIDVGRDLLADVLLADRETQQNALDGAEYAISGELTAAQEAGDTERLEYWYRVSDAVAALREALGQ